MTRTLLREEIRDELGEPDVEKTWRNNQINRYINAALRDLSCYGALYGSSLGEGDGTAIVELPSNVLRVTLARVGDTEYYPTTTGYTQYLDGAINLFTVAWDPSESAYLCTFSEEIANEADVEFVGNLSATELDPDDAGEDGTVLDVDDRFRNAVVYFCLDRALRGTEDDHRRFRELYLEELQRFGFRAKLARIAQFHQPEKKSHNRCSW